MTTHSLHKRLDSILQFIAPHWSWVNCHMVNYLVDDYWKTYVPSKLQEEIIDHDSIQHCIETVFWNFNDNSGSSSNNFPEFTQFRHQALRHSLQEFDEIIIKPQEFEEHILGVNGNLKHQIKIKEFLTEKKRHEVEITAGLVNNLIQFIPWEKHCIIVDAGDGKGYLSSRLALEYGHKVLGIDSNTSNTENAIKRNQRLKKAWNGLKERAEMESKNLSPARHGNYKQKREQNLLVDEHVNSTKENNYKTVDKFITSEMDLDCLLQEQFPDILSTKEPVVCLTGLHTCGNLAASCLKLFHSRKSCKLLCNVGCCYHLLKEKYSGPEFFGSKQISDTNHEIGFPLSQYLQAKQVKLGRNARMLAAQSIERTMTAKELPSKSLFYRALLELLIREEHPDLKDCVHVGKIRKYENFLEYVDLCRKKYPNLNLNNERILKLAKLEEEDEVKLLNLFYLLRMTFAPVLESLILLDRLLYLQELGYKQSFLIPIFDPVVSPRHFAIVAMKCE